MSERRRRHIDPAARTGTGRDSGLTLVEVMVATMLTGLLVASLSVAIVSVLHSHEGVNGRFANASAEQMAASMLSTDLSSAETVETDAAASPCQAVCPAGITTGGSNAMLLTWTTMETPSGGAPTQTITRLSYRYAPSVDGYQLIRAKCVVKATGVETCSESLALSTVVGPPSGTEFVAGKTSPWWAFDVYQPPAPADSGTAPSDQQQSSARRVVVTVNGGGYGPGLGGGVHAFSISAGGTTLKALDLTGLTGRPTFSAARSRCGGNFGLVIDRSGSIGDVNMKQVLDGAKELVRTFAGTPVQIQVVSFAGRGRVVGESLGGNEIGSKYYDMLDPTQVQYLIDQIGQLYSTGETNWEDAMFRMFLDSRTGAVQPQLPDTVLFFTDGLPNTSRLVLRSTDAPAAAPATDIWPNPTYWLWYTTSREDAWTRADAIVKRFRGSTTRFIGVGVGAEINAKGSWNALGAGYHMSYERGFHYAAKIDGWFQRVTKATYDATPAADRMIDYNPYYDYWEATDYLHYSQTPPDGRKATTVYAPPYDSYEFTPTAIDNSSVLQTLVTGSEPAVPGVLENGRYVNAAQANMYVLPDWGGFASALQAVALAECGGTLTLRTATDAGPVSEAFTYQNTAVTNAAGQPGDAELKTVTTSGEFPSGTFDFTVSDGEYLTAEIMPAELSDMNAFEQVDWTCTARGMPVSFSPVPIPDSSWTGVQVRIAANQAVSCTNTIRPVAS